jgi:hypothetical protein
LFFNHLNNDLKKIQKSWKTTLNNIILRIVATFAASGLSVIGAGAIAGIPLWKACFMAGMAGVATVIEGLSRAFLDDGKLSVAEINQVFNKVDKKAKTE